MYNTKDIQSLLEDMSVAMNGLVDRVSGALMPSYNITV